MEDEDWRPMGKQFPSLFLLAEVILLFSSRKLERVAEISSLERCLCSASQLQEERGQRRGRLGRRGRLLAPLSPGPALPGFFCVLR